MGWWDRVIQHKAEQGEDERKRKEKWWIFRHGRFPETKKCPKCREKIPYEATVCPNCTRDI